jgi:hypothetical protein
VATYSQVICCAGISPSLSWVLVALRPSRQPHIPLGQGGGRRGERCEAVVPQAGLGTSYNLENRKISSRGSETGTGDLLYFLALGDSERRMLDV